MTDATGTDPAPEGGPQRVVVGVDGSPSSRNALLWALAAAARTQARAEVVRPGPAPAAVGAAGREPAASGSA